MPDWMSKLERAKALLDAGALTPEEFEAEKAKLLPTSSTSYAEPIEPSIDHHHGNETVSHSGWIKFVVAAVIAIIAAAIGYLIFADRSQPSAETSVPSPIGTPAPTASSTPTPTSTPPPTAAEFGCVGAYSNVSFSEESGDGSGLFLRISKAGSITWKYYEGGISRGIVKVSKRTADRITASVRYADYPSQPPSSVVLTCKDGRLSASSNHIGDLPLRRLTAKQADELDL